jgi:hypothetical protein
LISRRCRFSVFAGVRSFRAKKDPNDVVDDFRELANDSLHTWQQMCNQLGDAGLKKNASVDAFLNVVIGWESFLSDWHIAAINRDSSALTEDLEQWIKGRLAEKPALALLLSLSIPKHPDLALVRELLDPTGRNVALWPRSGSSGRTSSWSIRTGRR